MVRVLRFVRVVRFMQVSCCLSSNHCQGHRLVLLQLSSTIPCGKLQTQRLVRIQGGLHYHHHVVVHEHSLQGLRRWKLKDLVGLGTLGLNVEEQMRSWAVDLGVLAHSGPRPFLLKTHLQADQSPSSSSLSATGADKVMVIIGDALRNAPQIVRNCSGCEFAVAPCSLLPFHGIGDPPRHCVAVDARFKGLLHWCNQFQLLLHVIRDEPRQVMSRGSYMPRAFVDGEPTEATHMHE